MKFILHYISNCHIVSSLIILKMIYLRLVVISIFFIEYVHSMHIKGDGTKLSETGVLKKNGTHEFRTHIEELHRPAYVAKKKVFRSDKPNQQRGFARISTAAMSSLLG